MANGQVDGKTWSIPFQRSTIVLYWNKDAFKEAGLDPEKAPATWDEMVEMSKKLVKKDASGNMARWGVEIPTTGYAYWMLQALAIENGQKLMNDAGNEVYLTAPKTAARRCEYWVDLSRKHNVMPMGSIDWANAAHRLPRRQDRDDVAHHGQPDGGEGRRQVQLRRRHAAGQGAARLADRRRQLLYLQERIARAAEGRRQVHPVDDGPERAARVEHQDRLRRGFPGRLQDPAMKTYVKDFPAAIGRAGSARACGARTVGSRERPHLQVRQRCRAGGGHRHAEARRRRWTGAQQQAERVLSALQISDRGVAAIPAATHHPECAMRPMVTAVMSAAGRRSPCVDGHDVNAWLLLLPAAVLLVAFTHYPILATHLAQLLLTRRSGTAALRRPRQLPCRWPTIRSSGRRCVNNFWFALGTIPTSIALALLMALWVNQQDRRPRLPAPRLLHADRAADDRGRQHLAVLLHAANTACSTSCAGCSASPATTGSAIPSTVLGCLIVVAIWKEAGFFMIFYLAALQQMSPDLAEAAAHRGRVALVLLPARARFRC